MRDELKTVLDTLLESYDENVKKEREQRKVSKSKYVDFVEEFYQAREEIIWPAMMEIVKLLKSKAHDSRIDLVEDEFKSVGGTEANICMYIYPNGEGADTSRAKDYPYLSFTVSWHEKAILIHSNTRVPRRSVTSTIVPIRGSAGLRGSCTAKDITKELVQDEIVKLMKEVFHR